MAIQHRAGSVFNATQLHVETNLGEQTPNAQKVEMKPAGKVGGDRARMLPSKTRPNASFV